MLPASNKQYMISEESQQDQQWAEVLSELHAQPVSVPLQAYFTELKERVPSWDIDDFIRGGNRFAGLWGSKRVEVFPNRVTRLHTPNSFTKAWNEIYSQQPITALDLDIRLQCLLSWLSGVQDGRWVLIYQSEAPLSQGLNKLLQGPTTLDCGMFCQLLIWMAIRYLIGDMLFDNVFRFQTGTFILTQSWYQPMNEAGTVGSLLYPFYDHPQKTPDVSLGSKPRLETRTVFNHPAYFAKHPGGTGRLQNITQINDYSIIFDPESHQNILLYENLSRKLRQTFDAPQSLADFEKLEFYSQFPQNVPSFNDIPQKSAEAIAEEAKKFATYTLSDEQWEASRGVRDYLARGLRRVLNFPRLTSRLQEAEKAYANRDTDYDVLYNAKRAQERDQRRG
jgi:hypothetical protein